MNEFIARIGTFFLLMGIVLALLFIASDTTANFDPTKPTDYNYLFFALVTLAAAYFFRKKAAPPPAAERFKFLRKMRENSQKRKDDKEKAKQAKKK